MYMICFKGFKLNGGKIIMLNNDVGGKINICICI